MENEKKKDDSFKKHPVLGIIAIFVIVIAGFAILGSSSQSPSTSRVDNQTANWIQNIPQSVQDKLTSEELNQFVDMIKKTTPEFRQTFVSDYAKQMARENRLMVFGVWAKSLGLSVNYQLDDVWEISDKIKAKTNNFALYKDEAKFLEFITIVTDKQQGGVELQKFLESGF